MGPWRGRKSRAAGGSTSARSGSPAGWSGSPSGTARSSTAAGPRGGRRHGGRRGCRPADRAVPAARRRPRLPPTAAWPRTSCGRAGWASCWCAWVATRPGCSTATGWCRRRWAAGRSTAAARPAAGRSSGSPAAARARSGSPSPRPPTWRPPSWSRSPARWTPWCSAATGARSTRCSPTRGSPPCGRWWSPPLLDVPDPRRAVLDATPARFRSVRVLVVDPPSEA